MMFALEYFSIFPFPALPTVTAVYTLIISWASYVHSPQTAFPAPFSSGCSRCHSQPLLLVTTLQLQTNFKLQSSELLPLPLSPCCLMHYFHLGKFSTSFLLVNIFLNSPKGLLTFMNNTMKSHLLSSSSAFCVFSVTALTSLYCSFFSLPADCELIDSRDFYSSSVHRPGYVIRTEYRSFEKKIENGKDTRKAVGLKELILLHEVG